jgi:hypothetical protein
MNHESIPAGNEQEQYPETTEVCDDCGIHQGEDIVTLCPLHAAALELLEHLKAMNHMGGADPDKAGYCICPVNNGQAPDHKHATVCSEARRLIAKAEWKS